jgi:hypothetical protein
MAARDDSCADAGPSMPLNDGGEDSRASADARANCLQRQNKLGEREAVSFSVGRGTATNTLSKRRNEVLSIAAFVFGLNVRLRRT